MHIIAIDNLLLGKELPLNNNRLLFKEIDLADNQEIKN